MFKNNEQSSKIGRKSAQKDTSSSGSATSTSSTTHSGNRETILSKINRDWFLVCGKIVCELEMIIGTIGGIFAIYQMFSAYISPTEDRFELYVVRRA